MSSEPAEDFEEFPEVKYIDSAEYRDLHSFNASAEVVFRWVESLENDEEKWFRLISNFMKPLAGREGFCFRIVEKFARTLNSMGMEVAQSVGGLRDISHAAPRSVGDSGSLPLVLESISDITRQVNLAHYISKVLSRIGQSRKMDNVTEKTVYRERLTSLYLYHMAYRQGLENLLSNSRLLRNFRYSMKPNMNNLTAHVISLWFDRDMFTMVPEASSLALQMILEDWNCPLQSEKIVQIAHANTLQMRSLHVKGDGLYFLNEAMNCALALSYREAQEEMDSFSSIITNSSMNPTHKLRFHFWRLISSYQRSRQSQNAQGFLVTAQRMEEESKTDAIGEECTVIVETSCQIRKECKQHDEITAVINDTVTRFPALGPRMMQLATHCNVGYENEVLLQQMCDFESQTGCLHPSELTWLDHVDNLVKNVHRYGSVRKTMEKSLKIMFEFLDFDSNRFNERAWILMEKVLEFSDPSFVVAEWRSRVDWWPRYQKSRARDGRKMCKEVSRKKRSVLEALQNIVL